MLKKVGLGLGLAALVLILLIATRPSSFRVERSATVAAPAEVVFAQVNDLHLWAKWSPWERQDPAMKKTFEGAAAGVGAVYSWTSETMGAGRMTVAESQPHERIAIKLEFLKPFPANHDVEFLLKPDPQGVQVTWAMSGHSDFLGKAFSLFVNMDSMVGKDFEQGLAELKRISEEEAKRRAAEAKQAEAVPVAAPTAP